MIAAEAGHGGPHDRGLSPWRRRPPTNEIAQVTVAQQYLRAREDAWARTDPVHRQLCTDVVRQVQPGHLWATRVPARLSGVLLASGYGA
jgi:hypothetical protein